MTLEITVERHFCNVCKRNGAWAMKGENVTGFPDRIVMAGPKYPRDGEVGRVCFVELKKVDGVVKIIQNRIHKALRALGQDVEVLWTKEQVDAWAEKFFG